jgi:hypothetical protein
MVRLPVGISCPDDVLAWLLEPRNPSARTLALTQLLHRPADDPEVVAARRAIPRANPARDILLAQYPQGYWMHPGIGYSPRYRATLWQILFLAQLGMERNAALDRAVAHVFDANQREDGAFRASKERGDTPACLNGSLLWALETLGYGDTEGVARAWSWLAGTVADHGLAATYAEGRACPWAAVKVLRATNAVPEDRRTLGMEMLNDTAAGLLLDDVPDLAQDDDDRWFRLTFPLAHSADLLQWLAVLIEAGYGKDRRVGPARAWLADKCLPDGTWPLERSPGKRWADFGSVGEPNKWVTLRALSVGR